MKLCKCGEPVRSGTIKQYYKKRDGILIVYEYPHNQCQACTNKTKGRIRKSEERLIAY